MGNVTVEVIGNSSGGSAAPQPQPSIGSSSSSSSMIPDNSRMIEDIRREMRSRGVLMVPGTNNMSQLINQYGQNLRSNVNDRITDQFDSRRQDIRNKYGAKYQEIEDNLEKQKQQRLASSGTPNNPFLIAAIDQQQEGIRNQLFKKYGQMQDQEEAALDQEEAEARKTADEELTKAIKELTDYFKREEKSGVDENSYIGKLRAQQRELIQQRESARTEDEAVGYSRQLAEVNEKLREVLSGESGQGGFNRRRFQDPVMQTTRGIQQLLGGLQGGDIGSVIMGAGSTGVALSGAGMTTAMKALGWIGLAAGAAKGLSDTAKDYESMSSLAALRSPSLGYSGSDSMHYLNANIADMRYGGLSFTDYGMNRDEFASEAARRVKQRGIGDNFFEETMKQIGLERNLALDSGALGAAGQYDRYGISSTDAISRLVTMLNGIKGSGVDYTDFTRVQEKFNIQQQIMGGYMSRSDKPNYDVANQSVAAFSAVRGITQDARLGSDYAQFQNAIQNPANDRMRALIYGAVADIMPETAGRMDLIDRAIRNPENEGKIMQAVIQRVTAQFGGTDTQMGYFVLKNLFPNIAPDRLDNYIRDLSDPNSQAGRILAKGMSSDFKTVGDKNADTFAKQSGGFVTGYTTLLKDISETLKTIAGKITGTTWQPSGPAPRAGNQ